ncbi:MAG TPA: methyltransferase [Bacteroidales bacterium]|nr:methyltransferase [Bacteroidales bacterium]
MRQPFQFKQFSIADDCCAMKLSSDAVLLGAATDPGQAANILDIGTGCGILALMLAQKSNALIDAVETDNCAARQASQNFGQSQWNDRIKIHQASIQQYAEKCTKKYGCIVCNPPYFQGQLKSSTPAKSNARHNSILDFAQLSHCVSRLLPDTGTFWAIMPVSEKNNFLKAFMHLGLYCFKNIFISDKPDRETKRLISCFSFNVPENVSEQTLILKNHDNSPSADFIALTKDFYLEF